MFKEIGLHEKLFNTSKDEFEGTAKALFKKLSSGHGIVLLTITKLVEKFNIEYLKQKFIQQSEIKIGKYIINLNSRELILGNRNLRLTEKEVNIIIYLSKFNKPKKIEELQIKVWGYHSELETHTVETHVYRLRKKILNYFNDDNFIISKILKVMHLVTSEL